MCQKTCIKTPKNYKAKNKKRFFGISSHQKWFENPQLGIISQTLYVLNLVHTWTSFKLKHN
jgi:hypothetical protein